MSSVFTKLQSLIYFKKFNSEKERIINDKPTRLESLLVFEKLKNKQLQEEICELKRNKEKEEEETFHHINNLCENGGVLENEIIKIDDKFYRRHHYYSSFNPYGIRHIEVDESGIPLEIDEHIKKFEPWEFELSSDNL